MCRLAIAMLATSAACNLAVLFLPFMQLRIGLGSQPYSLFRSVRMFWDSGLYVLAVLVVGFSIVFPFAKLAVLTAVLRADPAGPGHRRWLDRVERLGKWSMLDVLLVCLILTLTSGQLLVHATPLVGIPVFTAAIVLSMLTGELLSASLRRGGSEERRSDPDPEAVRRLVVWLALGGLALLGALLFPFLRIRDWKLTDNAYSLLVLPGVLWHAGSKTSAIIVGAFLIVAPVAAWLSAFGWWWRARRGIPAADRLARFEMLRRWSMIDVFGLALAIFLVEGDYLMRTEVRWGALFLVAVVAIKQLAFAGVRSAAEGSRRPQQASAVQRGRAGSR